MIIQLSFLFNRISEFELKTSLSSFTLESKQEVEELRLICEDALQSLEKMEVKQKLTENSEKGDALLLEEINAFRPKLAHIRQRSEEIFIGSVSSKRLEFDPVLENIYDRWYALIKDSEKVIISIDAVESITPSTKTETEITAPNQATVNTLEDPDEVIDTLPEDETSVNSNQSSPLKRNLPVSPIVVPNQSQVMSKQSSEDDSAAKRVCFPDKNVSEVPKHGAITYSLANELINRPPSPPITTSYEHSVLLSSSSRGRDSRPKSKSVGAHPGKKGQYPKPKWYVNSKELHQVRRASDLGAPCKTSLNTGTSTVSGVSPERVKVTVNVLPSPQKTAVPSVTTEVTKLELQSQQSKPDTSIIQLTSSSSASSPATSTPSVCGEKPSSIIPSTITSVHPIPTIQGDQILVDNDQEKKEKSEHVTNIDQLIKDMDEEINAYKSPRISTHQRRGFGEKSLGKRSQEIKSYSIAIDALLEKLALAKENISGMNKERDLALKRDLIDMELRLLEAEVGTLLSRGTALLLMLEHANEHETMGSEVQEKSNLLQETWSEVKRQAEFEKSKVLNTKDLVNFYRKMSNDLHDWINRNEANGNLDPKKIGNKRKLFHNMECLASRLRKDNAFGDFERSYLQLVKKWERIESKCDPSKHSKANRPVELSLPAKSSMNNQGPNNEKGAVNNEVSNIDADPTSPSRKLSTSINLATRIEKLRNAIKAINRQLGTQILSGKELENLKLQKESLNTVKEALEKLKALVVAAEKDTESLFSSDGSMSVEFLEKLTGLNEKLQEEWKWVNNRYSERQSVWVKSLEIMQNFERKQNELVTYLANKALHEYHEEKNSNEIESARSKIAYYVMDCQEIKSKLSTQEASKGK